MALPDQSRSSFKSSLKGLVDGMPPNHMALLALTTQGLGLQMIGLEWGGIYLFSDDALDDAHPTGRRLLAMYHTVMAE